MPTDLGLDSEVANVARLTDRDVVWAGNLNAFVQTFRSDHPDNPFGSAAKLDAGTSAGNVLLLDGSGRSNPANLPDPAIFSGAGTIGSGTLTDWGFTVTSSILSLNRLYAALCRMSIPDTVILGDKDNTNPSATFPIVDGYSRNPVTITAGANFFISTYSGGHVNFRAYFDKYRIRIVRPGSSSVASADVELPIDTTAASRSIRWTFADRSVLTDTLRFTSPDRIQSIGPRSSNYVILSIEGVNSEFVPSGRSDNLRLATKEEIPVAQELTATRLGDLNFKGIIRIARENEPNIGTISGTNTVDELLKAVSPLLVSSRMASIQRADTSNFGLAQYTTPDDLGEEADPAPTTITNRVISPAGASEYIERTIVAEFGRYLVIDNRGKADNHADRTRVLTFPSADEEFDLDDYNRLFVLLKVVGEDGYVSYSTNLPLPRRDAQFRPVGGAEGHYLFDNDRHLRRGDNSPYVEHNLNLSTAVNTNVISYRLVWELVFLSRHASSL